MLNANEGLCGKVVIEGEAGKFGIRRRYRAEEGMAEDEGELTHVSTDVSVYEGGDDKQGSRQTN